MISFGVSVVYVVVGLIGLAIAGVVAFFFVASAGAVLAGFGMALYRGVVGLPAYVASIFADLWRAVRKAVVYTKHHGRLIGRGSFLAASGHLLAVAAYSLVAVSGIIVIGLLIAIGIGGIVALVMPYL